MPVKKITSQATFQTEKRPETCDGHGLHKNCERFSRKLKNLIYFQFPYNTS